MQFSSISPIDKTLLGATTTGHCGPGVNDNERVLLILQSSSITVTSSSDCLMLYTGHSFGESWSSVEKQAVGLFCSTSRLDHELLVVYLSSL